MNADDHRHMARALVLAGRGLYSTDPNPRVGCVLVQGGEVVGEGWHGRAGEPHAEVWALRAAGGRARGATASFPSDPSSYLARPPPSTDALIAAGVTRVVAAMIDPNPLMGGKGMAALAAAGIAVESGSMTEAATALIPGFFSRLQHNRPRLRLKMAMRHDRRTAHANGARRWITGEAARHDVQRGRARRAAI